jgi:hypothetical protein
MLRQTRETFLIAALALTLIIGVLMQANSAMSSQPRLLTDPFLQLPTETSVRVVWFTEFAGSHHTVHYSADLKQTAVATTTRLSHTREDHASQIANPSEKTTDRPIWRHEAEVTGLVAGKRLPYRVTSVREDGNSVSSTIFSLTAKPTAGTPLKILLTSDHQLKHMVAANLQKVVETVGQVDLVLFAGDLVNIPDRASEWFDDQRGGAFFPVLQGRATYELEKDGVKTRYTGGALLQQAPMYTAIGNHEVMGRFSTETPLDAQFNASFPYPAAENLYWQKAAFVNPANDPAIRASWLKNNSFNVDTYEEIFSLPESQPGGKKYYAVTFGDLRLVVLYITNVWRHPGLEPTTQGKYREREQDFANPENWGYGQHLFEAIAKASPQYTWLEQELNSPEFKQAKYKVVMFHHPAHSLGENSVPAYTDPVQVIERTPDGKITAIRYEYPRSDDYIIRDVVPLLEQAKVQLVFFGHSHLWNRFVSPSGMHFLETSNVGNSYGAHVGNRTRRVPAGYKEDYVAIGNPNGLQPIIPTIAPLLDDTGKPMPYVASNDITAFSIFDTGTGTVSSYRFDTREPQSAVVKFDEFQFKR